MMQTTGGATPLMYACQQCKEAEVLEILRKQPHSVKDRDRTLKTPLHYCAENPNTSCSDAVLKNAPELVNAQDENGYCTLHLAVIAGNKALIKLLITKGADVNIQDNEGHSAAHWAIVSSEKEALEMIIRAGANPSTPDIHGGYPLHYAVQMCGSNCDYIRNSDDTIKVVETLINFGVDVNVKDKDGRQPILWAASAGSADAVIQLVSSGACVEAADKDGLTALHCAASRGHTATLETLITLCGANVDLIDGNGCSALFYSVTLGHADATELLLQLGAQPNRQDRKGRTPAHCGAAKGQLETLRILQKHGGNLWMRNVRGDIPLHEAVASGRKDLVLWLLSQNSEAINIANNDGRCPLHIASMYNNTEMVKILLDSKSLVNPVMRTSKGVLMTPLNVALCKGHRSCGKYLQLHGGVPFSKVSKMEPASVFAVRFSPSDDLIITAEKSRESMTSSQSRISRSRDSNDLQRSQEVIKVENADKKKVFRRRRKKKSPSSRNAEDSDSEDSIHDVKAKTAEGGKNEKNEDDNTDERNDEEKIKGKKIHLDPNAAKKEKNSKTSNINRKIVSTKPNEISEESNTTKSVTKTKAESKLLQRNKSFNETKNVSDLSPEDFPPLMQTINQLDTVIMEPDIEINKPENNYGESKQSDYAGVDLSGDFVPDETKEKQEEIEKIDIEIKTTSGEALSEEKNVISLKETEVQLVNETVNEDLLSEEKPVEILGTKKLNGNVRKDEMVTKTSVDEGVVRKSVKSLKSGSSGSLVETDIRAGKKNSDNLENREKNKPTVTPESDNVEDILSHAESNYTNEEAGEPIQSQTKISDENITDDKVKTDFFSSGYNNEVPKESLESDDLSQKVSEAEVAGRYGEKEKVEEIPKDETLGEDRSAQNERSSFRICENENVEISTEKEDFDLSQAKIAEEPGVVNDDEDFIVSAEKKETEGKKLNKREISEKLDPSGNLNEIEENIENSSKVVFLSETSVMQNNPDVGVTEQPNTETLPQTVDKKLVEVKQGPEIDTKQWAMLSNTKEEDVDSQKAEYSAVKENTEANCALETTEKYEDKEFRNDEPFPRKPNHSDRRQFKTPKVSRLCRRHRDFKEDFNQISVTQLVQNTIRKYHMERGIFYQLLELKRYQIRSGRANEQVLVKRLADEYERSRVFLGMKPFSGLYKFREFEKFLYDQLKALNARRNLIIPEVKSYDDIDALSGFLKKSRYKILSEIPQSDTTCTCITQRCHHSACAYTSVPCSAYITDLHRRKPKRECFFPRIDQQPTLKQETRKFTELPATLELIQGSEKHVITLPQNSPSRGKRYYVTFTIKGAPAFKEQNFAEDSKDYLKHRHAKSV